MSPRQLLLSLARRCPKLIAFSILLGFSGAIFNGIGTALIIPVLLALLGQPIALGGGAPMIQKLMVPFEGVSGEQRLLLMTAAILLALLCKNAANYANALVAGALKRRISNDLREDGIQMLLNVDMDYFVKTGVGDIGNYLNNELSRTASAISTITRVVTLSITTLVFLALLIALSWQLTLISTVLLLIVACINQFNIARSKTFGKQFSELSRVYSRGILDVLTGMRLVRTNATEAQEAERLRRLSRTREQAEFNSQANSALIEPISEMSGMIALLLIVLIGRQFIGNQVQEISAVLLTYLFMLFRTLPLVAQINSARNTLANLSSSVEVATHFLNRANKSFMENGSIPFTSLQEGIHFHHISMIYPGHSKQVLSDIDLYLPRNTTLALVGSSGSGKSTLSDLLPRFYDPVEGCVLIDGVNLRDLDFRSLRRCMGVVSQDTFLFNASIRDNIAYGYPGASDTEVFAAAKQANAYDFISQLPEGFATVIGDRGVMLSGGQRQRLAIARALLQNPEILILDEATSALDTVSERLVQEAIDNLSQNRTTLIVAHRLSTVQKADQIAVMEQGRVVELGSHEELLAKKGHYARLCELQLSDNQKGLDRQQLASVSYELRTCLNQLIGSLGLMVDDLIENPIEQREWMNEAYYSALHLIKSLEGVEREAETLTPSSARLPNHSE
jgi:ATP-binding cassette, subfamily B, bacterial MsbA